jgi:catechol 2,3-dioxygenase-like lactoylglutathione lyase family enzyme
MTSKLVSGLRSVSLNVPDVVKAEEFYTRVWHLDVIARSDDAIYLRGTGSVHHLLSFHRGERTEVREITFRARTADALIAIADAALRAGASVLQPPGAINELGGGTGVTVRDPDGRVFRVVHGDAVHADVADTSDRPIRLAHVVLNCRDVAATQKFFEAVFGFTLADRTRIMAFLNCDSDHHTVALADASEDSLNHIAFVMPDLESVMRGGGRMKDAGHPIEWGPGRHGPGANAFNYFIDPFGVPIEYTSEIEQIDDTYKVGGPDDWKWPPGRVDHWGISAPPSVRLKEAQKKIFFAASS